MNWRVVYREKEGRKVSKCFKAEGRDALFKLLSDRGIKAISLEVAGSECTSSSSKAALPFVRFGFLLSAIVVFGVLILVVARRVNVDNHSADMLKSRNDQHHVKRLNTTGIKTIQPRPSEKHQIDVDPPATIPSDDLFNGVPVLSRTSVTNIDGTIIEKIHTSDGKSHRVTKPPKPVFANASDQLIAMAISGTKSGVGMPPLPLSESVQADFMKSLDTPIEILQSDSDEIKLMKLDVMAVREELKELVSQGMTVREALTEHQNQVNQIAAYHQEALKMLQEIRERDGEDAANEFLKTVNEKLRGEGSPTIPSHTEKRKE